MINRSAAASLIRALLINSARDVGAEGPDYISGFGSMDAAAALGDLKSGDFMTGTVAANSSSVFDITIPSGCNLMKFTLVWNDSASASGAARALINDIDLEIINKQTGEHILPWHLSSYPQIDSLQKNAIRMKDTLNTVEQVSMQQPAAGTYQVKISANAVNVPLVHFSLAYRVENAGEFIWDYPLKNDKLVANENIRLRWTSTLAPGTGKLQVSRDKGSSWQSISDAIDLGTGSYQIVLPDSALELRFRMSVDSNTFETTDIISSPSRNIKYGYICDTAMLMYWDRIKGASSYQVYRMLDGQLQKLAATTDTSIIVPVGQPYHSLAAIVGNKEGVRGILVNALTQNVGCYINNFVVGHVGPSAAGLGLNLGTVYQVKNVRFIKVSDKNKVISEVAEPLQKDLVATDNVLHQGLNIYRAEVILENGTVIKSKEESVYYLNNKSHIIFPNPTVAGTAIYILSENVDDELAEIFDMQGRKISEFVIQEKMQKIPLLPTSRGHYAIRITKNGITVQHLSFLIL